MGFYGSNGGISAGQNCASVNFVGNLTISQEELDLSEEANWNTAQPLGRVLDSVWFLRFMKAFRKKLR